MVEAQHLPRLDGKGGPGRMHGAVDLRRQLSARDGNERGRIEAQLRPHERRLERRRALVVADQQVGGAQRETVHRARERDADMVVTGAPEILHRNGKAWLDDLNGH
jgi:hypothetical protein